jgi:hypothetical protein
MELMLKISRVNARFTTIIDLSGIKLPSEWVEQVVVYTTSIVVNRKHFQNVFNKSLADIAKYMGGFSQGEKILIIRVIRMGERDVGQFDLNSHTRYVVMVYKEFFNWSNLIRLFHSKKEGMKIFLIVEGVGLPILKVLFKINGADSN